MIKNVLVFPCGSEIGLEVYRALNYSTHFKLVGGSSVEDHGRFVYQDYIGDIPMVGSDDFIPRLQTIITERQIDFIIPTHDSVVLKLAEAKQQGGLDCEVLTSRYETCAIARSKSKTYAALAEVIRTPKIYQANELKPADLPVFLKPDVGQGSKGTHLANTLDEVALKVKNDEALLILEYLPGKEYTVDCFTSSTGKLLFCEGRERRRTMNGISVNTFTVDDDRFKQIAGIINQHIRFRGVWFFQLKQAADGQLTLLEIAPRVAGTMALVRCKGVNLVLLSLFDAMGIAVDVFENNYQLELDRGLENCYKHNINYKHVYLDFDDLVIFNDKVNPAVMAFVFQCVNKGVSVHLLTRHRGDLTASLKKYRLDNIFDELILITDGQEKTDFIKEPDSIFIDDSFAERKKVHEVKAIPVFDSHMIEALTEGKG